MSLLASSFGVSPANPDNTDALNKAAAASANGEGAILLGPGTLKVSGTVLMQNNARFIGEGRNVTNIDGRGQDLNTVSFDLTAAYAGLEQMTVLGFNPPKGTVPKNHPVYIDMNAPVMIRDCNLWGGNAGLFTQGIDGTIENCFVCGYVNCIISTGANWYIRVKMDDFGVGRPMAYGYWQQEGFNNPANGEKADSQENHFIHCDFTGPFERSLLIQSTQALTTVQGSVFGRGIEIDIATATMINACELTNNQFIIGNNGGNLSVTGCWALGNIKLPSWVTQSGNLNIDNEWL